MMYLVKKMVLFSVVALTLFSQLLHGESKLDEIKQLMDDAASGKNKEVTYIVSGDSTRDSYVAGQEYIYGTMLKQINVNYVHNAKNTNDSAESIPGLIGSKTGFTDLAGGNLVVAFEIEPGHVIVISVLGSDKEGRFQDVNKLYKATLNYFSK